MDIVRKTRHIVGRACSRGADRVLRPLGFAVVPAEAARPCAWGIRPILGSFPPASELSAVGDRAGYFIHNGYHHRKDAVYFNDTQNTDESQPEVYEFAQEVCSRERLSTVVDIGCGSGYKLIKFLGGLRTIGVDLPKTCDWLRHKYPDRICMEFDSFVNPDYSVDLVVASDVIEHLVNPDELMERIAASEPRYIILSTPDRNLLRLGTHNGPPLNPAHVREWNFVEFEAYVEAHFEVLEHFISCAPQATQCLLCRCKF